jgi:hypothetical protein
MWSFVALAVILIIAIAVIVACVLRKMKKVAADRQENYRPDFQPQDQVPVDMVEIIVYPPNN